MSWSPDLIIGDMRPWPDAVRVVRGRTDEKLRYVPEPPRCTMEPDGYYQEEYGIVTCSNCGELWQFECDGPKEHGWTCCPKCHAVIDYREYA